MKRRLNHIGAFFYMPLFFLLFNSFLFFVIGKPIIYFVTSSIEIFLLNEAPNFDKKVLTDVHFSDKKTGIVSMDDIVLPLCRKSLWKN